MAKRAPRAICVRSLSFPRPLRAKLLPGFFDFAHHRASSNAFGVDHPRKVVRRRSYGEEVVDPSALAVLREPIASTVGVVEKGGNGWLGSKNSGLAPTIF